jgi:hypothetical protein
MKSFHRRTLACALAAGVGISWLFAAAQTTGKSAVTIRRVAVLGGSHGVEIEVTASEPVMPQSQVVAGPDRLVIDFPNAVPGSDLHNMAVNRGEVNAIRVGLFAAHPPVTRVVLDLKTAQSYQVFSSGKTVIVKLGAGGQQAPAAHIHSAVLSQSPAHATLIPVSLPAKPAPRVEVEFQDGKLSIRADKATLAEVLYAVHRRTGADIPIPAGAEQEQVAANLGPAPAREVLAALLNGSRFNFIIMGSAHDPAQLKSVLLTPRGGGVSQPANYSPPPPTEAAVEPQQPPAQADPPTEQAGGEQQQQQQPPQ